jgi:hypothetical protein
VRTCIVISERGLVADYWHPDPGIDRITPAADPNGQNEAMVGRGIMVEFQVPIA